MVVYLGAYPSFSAWQTAWLVNEVKIPFGQSTNWIAIWLGPGLNFFVTGHYGAGSYAYVSELFLAQIRGSVQASFAVFIGFAVSFAPTIPPLIAQNHLDHISPGFLFPMVLTFAAAAIFLFVAPETARKPLEDIVQ